MSEVHRGRGYVYSIQYHIVWCVKYRYKLLYGQINNKNQGSRLGFFIESYLCFRKVYFSLSFAFLFVNLRTVTYMQVGDNQFSIIN